VTFFIGASSRFLAGTNITRTSCIYATAPEDVGGTKTSNGAAPQLSAAQIACAATDAWACRELFLRFRSLGLLRAKAPAGI